MTIEDAMREMVEAAEVRGLDFRVQNDTLCVGLYEISLREDDGVITWYLPAIVGGRYIYDQSGELSRGDCGSVIELLDL